MQILVFELRVLRLKEMSFEHIVFSIFRPGRGVG